MVQPTAPVTVVVITRDRCAELLRTLAEVRGGDAVAGVVVVDNASADGTVDAVRSAFPDVVVVGLDRNRGAAGRNVGVALAETPYVAFADDDSWWAPGSLDEAARVLDAHPDVAVVAATVVVGPGAEVDPTCLEMACSPLPARAGLPGPSILGFIACGAVVRRTAFLDVGGFDERFGVGGEEALVAIDLARAGWQLCYVPSLTAIHRPSPSRDPAGRRRRVLRNDVWVSWLRRRWATVVRDTGSLAWAGRRDAVARSALADAVRQAPRLLWGRRPVDVGLEQRLRLLER